MKINRLSTHRSLTRAAMLFACALLFAAPREAFAHARLLKSSPSSGDTVKTPGQVELWFSELLDGGGFSTIVVFSVAELKAKTHTNLADGETKVDSKDRTHLTVDLKALPPGEYVVDWRVLSLDGHSAPGRFKFKIGESQGAAK